MNRLPNLQTPPGADASMGRSPLLLGALILTLLGALLLAPGIAARAADDGYPAPAPAAEEQDWPTEVVNAFAHVPVQERGRVMPLDTWASVAMLRMNHKRSLKTPADRTLKPTAWLLDVIFRPALARTYRSFLVETSEVIVAMGLEIDRKKRDRFSYDELEPGRKELSRLAREYGRKPEKERDPVEGGIVALAHNLAEFEALTHFLDFARARVPVPESQRDLFEGRAEVRYSEVAAQVGELLARANRERGRVGGKEPESFALLRTAVETAQKSGVISLFAPTLEQQTKIREANEERPSLGLDAEEWLTPWQVVGRAVRAPSVGIPTGHVEMLRLLQTMTDAEGAAPFTSEATAFQARAQEMATAIGLYDKIDLEVFLTRFDPFGRALVIFILAFLLVAISWIRDNKWVVRGAWTLTTVGLLLVTAGIVIRCIIKERPPVKTLYETVLFITAFAVLASLITERLNRKRIAFALAPAMGLIGLFVAARYEMVNRQDTMPQLVAVLDTNFWLATHVTCISIGYSASLLTGAVAHIYVLGKVFGLKKHDASFYRSLSSMIYGMLAFALIFSVIGTILGGIWANESWGRFWGWDPKENGALMIVLWQLAMVHGRMGGYIKAFGVAQASIFLGIIVAFSWWGVNLLGIGLHSYGFTAGIMFGLMAFYGIELFVMLLGFGWWLANRGASKKTPVAS